MGLCCCRDGRIPQQNVEKRLPAARRDVRAGARPVHGTVPRNAREIRRVARAILVGNRRAVSLGDAVRRGQLLLVQLRRVPRPRQSEMDGRRHHERVLQPAGQERAQRDGRENRFLLVSV